MKDNPEMDLRFKDDHEYQVGIRLIMNTGAADKQGGVTGRGMVADESTAHVHSVGDTGLPDSSTGNIQDGIRINSIDIEW